MFRLKVPLAAQEILRGGKHGWGQKAKTTCWGVSNLGSEKSLKEAVGKK